MINNTDVDDNTARQDLAYTTNPGSAAPVNVPRFVSSTSQNILYSMSLPTASTHTARSSRQGVESSSNIMQGLGNLRMSTTQYHSQGASSGTNSFPTIELSRNRVSFNPAPIANQTFDATQDTEENIYSADDNFAQTVPPLAFKSPMPILRYQQTGNFGCKSSFKVSDGT
jgi:hypothetical protein